MLKKVVTVLAISSAAFGTHAHAQPLMTYTYTDVAYQWTSLRDSVLDNTNEVDVKLSASPVKHFALEGGYNYAAGSVLEAYDAVPSTIDIDTNIFKYGGAGWYSLQDGLDLVARVGGIHARASLSEYGTFSNDGVYAGASLRYLALDELETDFNVLYENVNSGVWTFSGTALYAVHEHVALKADAGITDEADVILLAGVRLAL